MEDDEICDLILCENILYLLKSDEHNFENLSESSFDNFGDLHNTQQMELTIPEQPLENCLMQFNQNDSMLIKSETELFIQQQIIPQHQFYQEPNQINNELFQSINSEMVQNNNNIDVEADSETNIARLCKVCLDINKVGLYYG